MVGVGQRVVEQVVEDLVHQRLVGEDCKTTFIVHLEGRPDELGTGARASDGLFHRIAHRNPVRPWGENLSLEPRHSKEFVGEGLCLFGLSLRRREHVVQWLGQFAKGALERHRQVAAGYGQGGAQLMDRDTHELAFRLLRLARLLDQSRVAKQQRAECRELLERLNRRRIKRLVGGPAHGQEPNGFAADDKGCHEEATVWLHHRFHTFRCPGILGRAQLHGAASRDPGQNLGHQWPARADQLPGRGRFDHHLSPFQAGQRRAVGAYRR